MDSETLFVILSGCVSIVILNFIKDWGVLRKISGSKFNKQ